MTAHVRVEITLVTERLITQLTRIRSYSGMNFHVGVEVTLAGK